MAEYRKATSRGKPVPGIFIRHAQGCPAEDADGTRCRCEPSYRTRRRDLGWSPTFKSLEEAQEWKASAGRSAPVERERKGAGVTFGALMDEWWTGVESGTIGKRKGRKGSGYSSTTLEGYGRTMRGVLEPLRATPAHAMDERFWQSWVDRMAREGLSRSRIANHLAVVSAIYGWASRSTRRLVPRNPTLAVELPPNDEKARERVATADEAAALLARLTPADQIVYGLAFYTGERRSEIHRQDWQDVDLDALWIVVRKSKSDAGTLRAMPIASPLSPILKRAWIAQGRPTSGMLTSSAMSGKLAERALKAWGWTHPDKVDAKAPKPTQLHERDRVTWVAWGDALEPISLHECRHTYASVLVAAGYNIKEVMEYMGHADLQTTSRYVKRLPQPREENAADRLNRYLAGGD